MLTKPLIVDSDFLRDCEGSLRAVSVSARPPPTGLTRALAPVLTSRRHEQLPGAQLGPGGHLGG